jgi:hypothetical protein
VFRNMGAIAAVTVDDVVQVAAALLGKRKAGFPPIRIRRTPVPDQAAFRIDFPIWLASLPSRNRRIAEALALGHSPKKVARRFRLSPNQIRSLRRGFYLSWRKFRGSTMAVAA